MAVTSCFELAIAGTFINGDDLESVGQEAGGSLTMSVLVGKVALVTGGSSGIGAATAKALAREGVRVALLARREERLEEVADEIRRLPGHALVCPADVTDSTTVRAVVERVLGQWKRIDILVNNAGRGLAAPLEATTPEDLRALMEVNLGVDPHPGGPAGDARARLRPHHQHQLGGRTPGNFVAVGVQCDEVCARRPL